MASTLVKEAVMTLNTWHAPKATLNQQLKSNLNDTVINRWHLFNRESSRESSQSNYELFEQWANEAYIKKGIDGFFDILNDNSNDLNSIDAQAERLKPKLKGFILDAGFLNASEKAFMSRHDFLDASLDFIKRASDEDPLLQIDHLGQAMRNFWIVNLLQALFQKPAQLNNPTYAYSMLYPYTDNIMDDQSLTSKDKADFCNRLSQTLHTFGKTNWQELSPDECRIHELCQLIYDAFDKNDQERVRFGLEWIQDAQINSLKQQSPNLLPYELDILGLSFDKGGASLIADALIVEPDLSYESLLFCYQLGAILQLSDDLQDTSSDAANGHQTVFSQLKDHFVFDGLLEHLFEFTNDLSALSDKAGIQSKDLVTSVLIPNTKLLLVVSAVLNDQFFSRQWIEDYKREMPVTAGGIKRIQKHLKKRFKRSIFGKARGQLSQFPIKDLSKIAML